MVLVKPQPWSKNAEATVLEFESFINRTADGTSGAGYYEFRTKNADRRQVQVGRIVKLVVYPDVQELGEIVSARDRQVLIKRLPILLRMWPRPIVRALAVVPFIS